MNEYYLIIEYTTNDRIIKLMKKNEGIVGAYVFFDIIKANTYEEAIKKVERKYIYKYNKTTNTFERKWK